MGWKRETPLTRDEVEKQVGTIGGFTIPTWRQRGGLVWILLIVVLLALVLSGGLPGDGNGVNFREVLKPFPATTAPQRDRFGSPEEPEFVARVARDVERTWQRLFRQAGIAYRPVNRVVFNRMGRSDCGITLAAASDHFYCEYDEKLVLDGGIAYAYQVAHAHAHHVQNVLGITQHIRRAQEEDPDRAREFWLRHELQADCLAGVWAHSAYASLDVAAAVDPAPLAVDPDHFVERETWGRTTAEQRARWFGNGFREGKAAACDTFSNDV